ncbi:MAG: hypothetical protein KGJ13_07760 [Patescibacteria group bacterium]|nr:hypothetical protein [Patescibacteria group bacterium]
MFDGLIGGFTREELSSFIPRDGTWKQKTKIIIRDIVYGTIGLFVLDVSWRLMDLFIDFVCDHIHWLHWLSDSTT